MPSSLAPCPSCSRHLRTTETCCPFCKTVLGVAHAGAGIPGATQRLSRAAALAFTASLSLTACSGTTVAAAGDSGPGDGSAHVDTGTQPADSGGVTPEGGDEPFDSGGIQPPYGLPPFDAEPPPGDAGTDG